MTNCFNTRLIKFLYISRYRSPVPHGSSVTSWPAGHRVQGPNFTAVAHMSFVRGLPPTHTHSSHPPCPGGPAPAGAMSPSTPKIPHGNAGGEDLPRSRLDSQFNNYWPLSGALSTVAQRLSPVNCSYFTFPRRSNHTALTIFVLQSPGDPLPRFYHFFIS